MSRNSNSSPRLPWHDRFCTPTVDQLREALPPPRRHAFDLLRASLLELHGVKEHCAWHGECWRWTIEYRVSRSMEPLAVIVPSPDDLQLAVPLSREFTQALPMKRLKRPVRDGLELAQEPFDTRWGVWSISSKSLIDDLQDLVELKLQHLARRAM
jgi:hypothetical protein